MAAILITAGLASCGNDNSSEATCNYYVHTDSIVYSDMANKEYDSIMRICLQKMEVSEYIFSEHAETNTGSAQYAMALCNSQAKSKYDSKAKQVITLSSVQEKLFALNDSLFRANNIYSASEIGLKQFSVATSLYNTQYLDNSISTATIDVK